MINVYVNYDDVLVLDVQKDKVVLCLCRYTIVIVTVPNSDGARDYLQSSVFLRGKCMARDVFAFSAVVRRFVVATAVSMRASNPLLRRRL